LLGQRFEAGGFFLGAPQNAGAQRILGSIAARQPKITAADREAAQRLNTQGDRAYRQRRYGAAIGGVADGRGVAAAIVLGASAVQIGTGFPRCPEASLPAVYAERLSLAQADETRLTRAFSGRSGRAIVNRFVKAFDGPDVPPPAPYPVQRGFTRPMREEAIRMADAERMQMWAGQSVRLARNQPAGIVTQQLWDEASQFLSK